MNNCSLVDSVFYSISQHFYDGEIILCYLAAIITSAVCAIAELIGRFKGGNDLKHITVGYPQAIFYTLNVFAGMFTLFSSEALGSTEIFKTASTNLPKAIVQSVGIAVAAFITFRTSISTVSSSKDGQKVEIGPGRLFAILLENIGYRIELRRAKHVADQLKQINPLPAPRAVLNFILPYCFDQSENAHGNRKGELEKTLEHVMSGDRDASPNERSTLMLNHLLPIFGIDVIKSAISLVSEDYGVQTAKVKDVGINNHEVLESTSKELDLLYQQIAE